MYDELLVVQKVSQYRSINRAELSLYDSDGNNLLN